MSVIATKVRAARAFLRQRKLMPPLSARTFAQSSDETGKSFSELLAFIMRLRQGGQNQESQRREILLAAAKSGA
jgi:hypothetical protein